MDTDGATVARAERAEMQVIFWHHLRADTSRAEAAGDRRILAASANLHRVALARPTDAECDGAHDDGVLVEVPGSWMVLVVGCSADETPLRSEVETGLGLGCTLFGAEADRDPVLYWFNWWWWRVSCQI